MRSVESGGVLSSGEATGRAGAGPRVTVCCWAGGQVTVRAGNGGAWIGPRIAGRGSLG